MKKLSLYWVFGALVLLCSCGNNETENLEKPSQGIDKKEGAAACLDFAITEKYSTLDPIKITDVTSFHILSQLYEPLLRFNEVDLSLEPLLAES